MAFLMFPVLCKFDSQTWRIFGFIFIWFSPCSFFWLFFFAFRLFYLLGITIGFFRIYMKKFQFKFDSLTFFVSSLTLISFNADSSSFCCFSFSFRQSVLGNTIVSVWPCMEVFWKCRTKGTSFCLSRLSQFSCRFGTW